MRSQTRATFDSRGIMPNRKADSRSQLPRVDLGDPAFWADIHTPLAVAAEVAPVAITGQGGVLILGAAEAELFWRNRHNVTRPAC